MQRSLHHRPSPAISSSSSFVVVFFRRKVLTCTKGSWWPPTTLLLIGWWRRIIMMVPDSSFPNSPKSETPVERFDLFPILRIARGLCLHCICHFSGRFFYLVGHGLMWEPTPVSLSFCWYGVQLQTSFIPLSGRSSRYMKSCHWSRHYPAYRMMGHDSYDTKIRMGAQQNGGQSHKWICTPWGYDAFWRLVSSDFFDVDHVL